MNNPNTTLKAKPILFTGPMVLAILDGRKAQTRRLIKPQPGGDPRDDEHLDMSRCPYSVGQVLWVRETWRLTHDTKDKPKVIYRAEDPEVWGAPWKPSIFMPRWASRITLRVTSVRVERLHEIGKDGRKASHVLAEGITREEISHWAKWLHIDDAPAHTYGVLWDSINGKKAPWSSNPWVWVIEFERRP